MQEVPNQTELSTSDASLSMTVILGMLWIGNGRIGSVGKKPISPFRFVNFFAVRLKRIEIPHFSVEHEFMHSHLQGIMGIFWRPEQFFEINFKSGAAYRRGKEARRRAD